MNKFEHVSSLSHQMSLVGRGLEGFLYSEIPYVEEGAGTGTWGEAVELYSEIQCFMGNGYMWPLLHVNRQTDMTENITFPQLRWRAVMKIDKN